MKGFFKDDVYEMPGGHCYIILNRILTEVEDPEYVPLCARDENGEISVVFGRKIKFQ